MLDMVLRALLSVCVMASISGCAAPSMHPRRVRIMLTASPDLNPDGDGRPSPVMVRIYELSEAGDFRQAGFFDLYDHDKSVLGNAALSRTVVAVRPNERLTLEHEVDSRSRHLAVMVAYRNIYRAKWRAVADLPDTRDSAWALTLDAGSLKIAAWGKDAAPRGASAQAGAAKSVAPRWDRLAHGGNPGGAGPDRSRQQGRNQTDRDRTGGYHVLEQ